MNISNKSMLFVLLPALLLQAGHSPWPAGTLGSPGARLFQHEALAPRLVAFPLRENNADPASDLYQAARDVFAVVKSPEDPEWSLLGQTFGALSSEEAQGVFGRIGVQMLLDTVFRAGPMELFLQLRRWDMTYSYRLMRTYAETMWTYLKSSPESLPEAVRENRLYSTLLKDIELWNKVEFWMIPELILERMLLHGPWLPFKALSALVAERQRNGPLGNRAA
jgi:hypothetical protein